jgi:hypothetical protein
MGRDCGVVSISLCFLVCLSVRMEDWKVDEEDRVSLVCGGPRVGDPVGGADVSVAVTCCGPMGRRHVGGTRWIGARLCLDCQPTVCRHLYVLVLELFDGENLNL